MYFEHKKDKFEIFLKAKKLGIFEKGLDEKKILKVMGFEKRAHLTLYEVISFLGNLVDVVGPLEIVKMKMKKSDEHSKSGIENLAKLFEKISKNEKGETHEKEIF